MTWRAVYAPAVPTPGHPPGHGGAVHARLGHCRPHLLLAAPHVVGQLNSEWPRHRMPFKSMNEGLKCGGWCGRLQSSHPTEDLDLVLSAGPQQLAHRPPPRPGIIHLAIGQLLICSFAHFSQHDTIQHSYGRLLMHSTRYHTIHTVSSRSFVQSPNTIPLNMVTVIC